MVLDYSKLGFKSGLEIHQQLNTSKLFCQCPSILRKEPADFTVKRELRPMAGETGEIDVAAVYEKTKQLHYIYECYKDTTCLVELDESPPNEINEEALDIAIQVAKMLHCTIPETVQVMRKTVIDGSNTSGFQRTMLIGLNGRINIDGKKVGINYVILEEDAARRTTETKESVTYRLDRLGVPLLEIVTAPDLTTPEEVKAAAERIGMLLRATGKAMRGIGTIRQDINVSVKGHCRVEMKGVQDLRLITKYVDKEIERQLANLAEEQHVRNVKPDFSSKFLRPLPTSARMYPESDLPLIKIDKSRINSIKLPEMPEEKRKRYLMVLNEELANQILHSDYTGLFDKVTKEFKVEPKSAATALMSTENEVKRKLNLESFEIRDEDFEAVFRAVGEGKLASSAILDVFLEVAKGVELEKALAKFEPMSDSELRTRIAEIKREFKSLPAGALIGKAIQELGGRAEKSRIVELVSKC